MDYDALMNSPWETIEWLYSRHTQQLVDLQKEQQKGTNNFI